ncbi:LacI family DNA-binding transcriptional regulator [Reichenbachiella ulvae]|uniref:LacI family transcriptional regulator n=1 Tax=Reichenbachiella ulvae TaxID=2980104 RepID=A0ABT3CTB6_9BACT|nr:LacI family DNA-binding transcriptional regulator [Reichenbachiella ulvae]MCV9386842.1 LacI family transcriptional regulator [Reichenbachiella ulvae]
MGKFVTIKELARELGLSHSTVSRALKNHPKISPNTREKVQELASARGYIHNPHAQNMGTSDFISLIVPDITVYFYGKIFETLQNELAASDYTLLLFNTQESETQEREAIDRCIQLRVAGVLAAISMQTEKADHFEKLLHYEIPLVFFDRVLNFLPVPKVIADDYRASYQATQHLIDQGRRHIAHITASIHLNNSNNRLYGYMDALKENGLKVNEELIYYYEMQPDSIEHFLDRALQKHPNLDGVTVFNDYVANAVVNALLKMGKKIPEEISVFGFSDEPIASRMSPQLSSVEQVAPRMASLALQKLLAIVKEEQALQSEKIVIHQELVIRETS